MLPKETGSRKTILFYINNEILFTKKQGVFDVQTGYYDGAMLFNQPPYYSAYVNLEALIYLGWETM